MKLLYSTFFIAFIVKIFMAFSPAIVIKEKIYKNLDEALQNPTEVYHLKLTRKKLKKFPLEILAFSNLKTLDLSKNKLDSLPQDLSKLTNLKTLLLKSNKFKEFPEGIFTISNLKKLSLANNEIINIPPAISNLKKLEELDFFRNSLENIPTSISKLKNLKKLDLRMIEIPLKEQERIHDLIPHTKILLTAPCNCGS